MRRVHRFHRVVARLGTTTIAVLALAPFGAPAGANTYTTTSVVQASGPSPFAGCDISGQSIGDTNYVNTELEPFVAVNPSDPTNVIGVWQQDRWSGGAARGLVAGGGHDGGQNWNESWAHFSVCSGGTAANGGEYQHASCPRGGNTPERGRLPNKFVPHLRHHPAAPPPVG